VSSSSFKLKGITITVILKKYVAGYELGVHL